MSLILFRKVLYSDRFWPSSPNIRLTLKSMCATNALAYSSQKSVTKKKKVYNFDWRPKRFVSMCSFIGYVVNYALHQEPLL